MSFDYRPPPTIQRFMQDDTHIGRFVIGPVGSGKSMGCIMELLRRSRNQAPDSAGIRRTRWVAVRNTMQQLRTTVLADVQQYLSPMVRYFVTDGTIQIRAPLDDGTMLHSDWMMVPLDTKEDQRRLLSLQLTGAWVNEVREVPIEIISALVGRLGRYPPKIDGGPTWHGFIADSNPWDTDSPFHERLVLDPDPKWALFHQPSGVGPYAENVDNLPTGYYENLMSDRDDGWSDVHVRSEWGTSNAGQAVFRRSFDAATHVRDMQAIVNKQRPLILGMDFGRTPCCLIGQVDNHGRLLVFKEVITEDVGLIAMLRDYLRPVILDEPYIGCRIFIVADPAGREKGQVTEESPFDALKTEGYLVYPAPSNSIAPRLLSVERMLKTTIAGEPGLQISRVGCPTLVRAMGNRYRYRKKRDGALEDVPEKLHPWSDVADCLQYMCMGNAANLVGRVMLRDRPTSRRPLVSAAGWT